MRTLKLALFSRDVALKWWPRWKWCKKSWSGMWRTQRCAPGRNRWQACQGTGNLRQRGCRFFRMLIIEMVMPAFQVTHCMILCFSTYTQYIISNFFSCRTHGSRWRSRRRKPPAMQYSAGAKSIMIWSGNKKISFDYQSSEYRRKYATEDPGMQFSDISKQVTVGNLIITYS